jgi:hypothetical protein
MLKLKNFSLNPERLLLIVGSMFNLVSYLTQPLDHSDEQYLILPAAAMGFLIAAFIAIVYRWMQKSSRKSVLSLLLTITVFELPLAFFRLLYYHMYFNCRTLAM